MDKGVLMLHVMCRASGPPGPIHSRACAVACMGPPENQAFVSIGSCSVSVLAEVRQEL